MPSARTFNDSDFGLLSHEVGDLWTRELRIHHLGRDWSVELNVTIDEAEGIELVQRQAFQLFSQNIDTVMSTAEREMRQLSKQHKVDLASFPAAIAPVAVKFPYAEYRPNFGILYTVTWDPGHGAAVKFVDGQLAEVGQQDIVL